MVVGTAQYRCAEHARVVVLFPFLFLHAVQSVRDVLIRNDRSDLLDTINRYLFPKDASGSGAGEPHYEVFFSFVAALIDAGIPSAAALEECLRRYTKAVARLQQDRLAAQVR